MAGQETAHTTARIEANNAVTLARQEQWVNGTIIDGHKRQRKHIRNGEAERSRQDECGTTVVRNEDINVITEEKKTRERCKQYYITLVSE